MNGNKREKLNKKILKELAEEQKKSVFTQKDVEFLKSLGIETNLERLKNGGKPPKNRN